MTSWRIQQLIHVHSETWLDKSLKIPNASVQQVVDNNKTSSQVQVTKWKLD